MSGRSLIRPRTLQLLSCALGAGVLLAACSSASTTSSTSSSAASGTSASGDTSSCLTTAKTAAAAVEKPITPVLPSQAANMSTMKGKNIWFVGVSASIPLVNTIGQGVQAAGTALGAKVTTFDGQGQNVG
jgi:hypothetical protein